MLLLRLSPFCTGEWPPTYIGIINVLCSSILFESGVFRQLFPEPYNPIFIKPPIWIPSVFSNLCPCFLNCASYLPGNPHLPSLSLLILGSHLKHHQPLPDVKTSPALLCGHSDSIPHYPLLFPQHLQILRKEVMRTSLL